MCDIPVIVPWTNSRYRTHRAVNKSERLSYLDSDAHPAKVEDRVAEHVRNFPTTWRYTERRARAYRPQLRRITVAAQTDLVLVRTERVARLHSHSTDLVVVPSWLACALRVLQGHHRHDRAARLRRRRAVPHGVRYRSAIGRPVPGERCHVTGSAATLKDDFHLRCPSGLLTTPSRNGERDSSNNRDTGNVGRGEKDRREFRSTGDTTVSFYGTSFGSPLLPRLGEYLHHGQLGCRTPHPPVAAISRRPLSLHRHLASVPRYR